MNASGGARRGRVTATGYRPHAYYLPDELHERFKAAWWSTREQPAPDGAPSLSTLVERILLEECERLEEKYNAGEPFPPAPRNARGMNPAAARRQAEWLETMWQRSRSKGESAGE